MDGIEQITDALREIALVAERMAETSDPSKHKDGWRQVAEALEQVPDTDEVSFSELDEQFSSEEDPEPLIQESRTAPELPVTDLGMQVFPIWPGLRMFITGEGANGDKATGLYSEFSEYYFDGKTKTEKPNGISGDSTHIIYAVNQPQVIIPDDTMVWIDAFSKKDGTVYFHTSYGARLAKAPMDLTYENEHTEAAAEDPGYDPDEDEEDGVVVTICTGASYYHAGTKKLYKYTRDITFPSWVKVSAETRTIVDTPGPC